MSGFRRPKTTSSSNRSWAAWSSPESSLAGSRLRSGASRANRSASRTSVSIERPLINDDFKEQLSRIPVEGRKLLCVILQQADHGSLRSKEPRIATMPEVHEACGLDVDGMYAVLRVLCDAALSDWPGNYPSKGFR